MISSIKEVDEAMLLLRRAYHELLEEGYDIVFPSIGAMVEVPSIVYQIEALLDRVDYISIGSNDLTQYLLAVDRNNPQVASLYNSLHPAVIQAIYSVVMAARRRKIPVTVCGEMAADPGAALILLGMGVSGLSMSASSLTRIKWLIRHVTRRRTQAVLRKVLPMEDTQMIRSYLDKSLEKLGLAGLIRAGK
jgi:phosphotransferase system enzyme I (PtsP)